MTEDVKSIIRHAGYKASSGRWIWTVLLAFVFAVLALNGTMPVDAVKDVTLIVIGFYFGRRAE